MTDEDRKDEAFRLALIACVKVLDPHTDQKEAEAAALAAIEMAEKARHAIPCVDGIWGCDVIGPHSHKRKTGR